VFERFTDRARRIVVISQEEARGLNHNYVGTEHLLLAFIHEGEGIACKTLEAFGVTLEAARAQVEQIIGRGSSPPSGYTPFTPRAKKVIELALREALALGVNYVGTEHLLLGLIREGDGVGCQVLIRLGCDLYRVRDRALDLATAYSGAPRPAGAESAPPVADDDPAMGYFGNRSRQAISLAKQAAQSFNHNYVGTPHILLGLVEEGTDFAARTLSELGITAADLRQVVAEATGTSTSGAMREFTPNARRVLDGAWRLARQHGQSYVGTEHILLALAAGGESSGSVIRILARFGLDLDQVRQQVTGTLPSYQAVTQDETSHRPPTAETSQPQQPDQAKPDDPVQQEAGEGDLPRPTSSARFERFTDGARRVVVLAQEQARTLAHNYIGTEHILLGLIHEGEGVAAKALESLGISLDAARQQVEEIIGRGQQAPSGYIPFTPRSKKVLELSLREALQLGHNYIGTEHILLGLIREGDGVAAQVLVRLGADLNRARQQVIQLLHGYTAEPQDAAPAAGPTRLESARPGEALRELIRLASAEAVALGHGYVGSEHLLIALLLVEHEGPSLRDLLGESVTADTVRELVVNMAGSGGTERCDTPITPEASDAIGLAEFEAMGFGEAEIAPYHLIVPLVAAENSIARRVLWELGVPDRAASLSKESGAEAAWGARLGVLTALAGQAADAAARKGR
jgi:ATP-dependent Clp protease ATP-binding subunit ClpA